MLHILRTLARELLSQQGRFRLWFALFRYWPGTSGQMIRARLLRPHLGGPAEDLLVREGVYIRNPESLVPGLGLRIGDHVFLQAGGGIETGDHVILGPGCKIWSQNHRAADPSIPIKDQGYDYDKVVIGNDVWIGANAFVMPGVNLPAGCVVAAGSVVAKKLYKPHTIIAGNPARAVGSRQSQATPSDASKSS